MGEQPRRNDLPNAEDAKHGRHERSVEQPEAAPSEHDYDPYQDPDADPEQLRSRSMRDFPSQAEGEDDDTAEDE